MTREETIKVLEVLNAFYAGGKNDPQQQAIAWHMVLADYDFNDAMNAVLRFAENDTREYAAFPAVGNIVGEIRAESARKNSAISEIIRAVGYGKEYSELSNDAKALIPESSYEKWLKIDAEKFSTQQNRFAAFLRDRQLMLENNAGKQ